MRIWHVIPSQYFGEERKDMKCMNCGATVEDDELFCGECGAKIVRVQICPNCNAEIALGKKFCTKCGTKLESQNDVAPHQVEEQEKMPESTEGEKVAVSEELPVEHTETVDVQREKAYEKVIGIYLEALFKKKIREETDGISPVQSGVDFEAFEKKIQDDLGGKKGFGELIISKANALDYSDEDTIDIMWDITDFRVRYADVTMSFLKKEGFGDAFIVDSVKKFILHKEGDGETAKLVPGKALSRECIEIMGEASKAPRGSALASQSLFSAMFGFNDAEAPYQTMDAEEYGDLSRIIEKYKAGKTPRSYYMHSAFQGDSGQHILKAAYRNGEYLYFYRGDGGDRYKQFEICRMNLQNGLTQVLFSSPKNSYNDICKSCINSESRFPLFHIFNNRIYFPAENELCSMNLDGSNLEVEMKLPRKAGYYSGVWVLPDGYLLATWDELFRFIRGIDNKPVKMIDLSNLIDFSDDVLISKDGKSIDIRTKQKTALSKIYPALKKQELLLVDSVNEIAYYLEKDENWSLDSKIIGTDKNGDIVDEWKVPYLSKRFRGEYSFGDGYESIVFNGFRMMAKYESFTIDKKFYHDGDNKGCPGYLAEYGRDGFENMLYQMEECSQKDQYRFARFHAPVGDLNLVLKGVDEKYDGRYYSTVITHDGKEFPFAKFR